MKLIPLTKGKFALVDDSDFEWLNQWKWQAQRHRGTYYAVRTVRVGPRSQNKKIKIRMSRLILGCVNRHDQGEHRDRNGLNNQRSNLRHATNAQNLQNAKRHKNNSSGFKGVRQQKNAWLAAINVNGQTVHLGRFKRKVDAAKAYNAAAIEHFGEYARPNNIL